MTGEDDDARRALDARIAERYVFHTANEAALARLAAEKAAQRPPVEYLTAADLNALPPRERTWAVEGWIPAGMSLLAGSPKIGKSWLVLAFALGIAQGSALLGGIAATPPRPVVYFGLEDDKHRIAERAGMLGFDTVPDLFYLANRAERDQVIGGLSGFFRHYGKHRPVGIVDTLAAINVLADKGESTYDRDYRLGRELEQVTLDVPGSSLLCVHHTRKQSAEDFLETVGGTFGVTGSCDTIAVLSRKRGSKDGVIKLTGRSIEEETYALTGMPVWQLDGGSLGGSVAAAQSARERGGLGERSAQILAMIYAAAQEGREVTTAEVRLAFGLDSSTASVYLTRLADTGRIEKNGRGKWTVSSVSSETNTSNTPNSGEPPGRAYAGREGVVSVSSVSKSNSYKQWFIREDGSLDWQAIWERSRPG